MGLHHYASQPFICRLLQVSVVILLAVEEREKPPGYSGMVKKMYV